MAFSARGVESAAADDVDGAGLVLSQDQDKNNYCTIVTAY
jgi:hypothetical protein